MERGSVSPRQPPGSLPLLPGLAVSAEGRAAPPRSSPSPREPAQTLNFSGVQSLRRLLLPAAPALPPDARGLGAAGHPLVLSLPLAESVWVSGAPRQPGLRAARPGRHARGRGTGHRRSPRPGRRQLVPTGPSGKEVPAGWPAPHGRMWGGGEEKSRSKKEEEVGGAQLHEAATAAAAATSSGIAPAAPP